MIPKPIITTTLLLLGKLVRGFSPMFLSRDNVLSQERSIFSADSKTVLRSMFSSFSSSGPTFAENLSVSVSRALGRTVDLIPTSGGGLGGGGGASVGTVADLSTGTKYFYKSAPVSSGGLQMLRAEYEGVRSMAETGTIRVPRPICTGTSDGGLRAFVVFERLDLVGGGGEGTYAAMGRDVARMHRCLAPDGRFGYPIDNTIGATRQFNVPSMASWPDFWNEKRLGHMLKLTRGAGLTEDDVEKLKGKTKELLSHAPAPSLLHGDLWGGNASFCRDGDVVVPVIFDPAVYYGDREADVAMTYLFGGFDADFYRGYEAEWPLPDGHERRRTVYNLYHILNHQVLFGGSYAQQAREMIEQILQY